MRGPDDGEGVPALRMMVRGAPPSEFTYLLPLLSSHLPLLLLISLISYEDLLDSFWGILRTRHRRA